MTVLWTSADLAAALGVEVTPPIAATGVSIDTRTLQKGDLFVALAGEKSDGHHHVHEAEAKGAAGAIISRPLGGGRLPLVWVHDTQKALETLGQAARARAERLKAVAITGSSGKTSTKEMLAEALEAHRSVASYNNHVGVPLTLARTPATARYGVYEVGMNHAGEIAPLAKQIRPHVAIVTNVGTAHLGNLGSVENIRREKLSISEGLPKGGVLVVPHDLDTGGVRADVTIRRFGGTDSQAVATEVMPHGDGWQVWARIEGQDVRFEVHHPGLHQVGNALAALLAAHHAGADMTAAAARLVRAGAVKGRGNIHHLKNNITLLDDSYNANPDSVKAALLTLARRPAHRRIAVLGDMLELGDHSAQAHRDLAAACAGVDVVVTVGPHMTHLHKALPKAHQGPHFQTQEEVTLDLRAGDVVLVKGSNGIGLSKLVGRLLEHHQESAQKHAV
jgi:UDP-N-acetylmuramoyl-tripeptide--D-alanyl-D-alanine ligase